MTIRNKDIFFVTLCLWFAVLNQKLFAQQENHGRWLGAVVMGHSLVPAGKHAGDLDEKRVFAPSWGLELGYALNHRFGLTWANEVILQEFVVNNDEVTDLVREYPFVTALEVSAHLFSGFSAFLGPGIELERNKNLFIFRGGIEYQMNFPGGWVFFPELAFETKEGKFSTWSFGFGFGKHFGRPNAGRHHRHTP